MRRRVVWKIQQREASKTWVVWANDFDHRRGGATCQQSLAPRLTTAIKEYIAQQDHQKVRNTIKALREYVKAYTYIPDNDINTAVLFGPRRDEVGLPYIDYGADYDP
ncbi:hypothetical protein PybrP1_003073 [[Pythium] brassicae (nom. inval.)]|nr:hypothetical protein PybrP1_003073 [[Pythium] brassicae (nom. inval.)]